MRNKKTIVYFVLLSLIFAAFISFYLYIRQINFYGEFSIVLKSEKNIVSSNYRCIGHSFTNKTLEIPLFDTAFISDGSWHFSKIEIIENFNSTLKANKFLLYTADSVYVLNPNYEQKSVFLSVVNTESVWKKLQRSNFLHSFIFKCLLIIIILTLLVVGGIIEGRKIVQRKSMFYFLYFFLLAIILLLYYNFIIKDYPSYWSGLWILIGIFVVICIILIYKTNIRKKPQNFLLIVLSALLGIIIFEIVLRCGHNNLSYSEKHFGYYTSDFDEKIITNSEFYEPNKSRVLESDEFYYMRFSNSLGLFDKEPDFVKDSITKLIIALGDSFTEGDGTHEDSTWLKFLEQDLIRYYDSKFEFINAGICGSDPFYEIKLLEDKLLVFNPDIVFLTIGYDINDVILRGGMERFDSTKIRLKEPKWIFFYKHFFIFRKIINLIYGNIFFLKSADFDNEVKIAEKKIKSLVLYFKSLGEQYNFVPVVVFYPIKNEVLKKQYTNWNELLNYCKINNIKTVDLLDFYVNEVGMNSTNIHNFYWKKDGHHNAKGYEKFAEGIFFSLKKDSIDIFSIHY